jgi:hypothetical protein
VPVSVPDTGPDCVMTTPLPLSGWKIWVPLMAVPFWVIVNAGTFPSIHVPVSESVLTAGVAVVLDVVDEGADGELPPQAAAARSRDSAETRDH